MNLLFVMSISGSIVFLLYLCTKPFSNRYCTAHWQYNFLKICLLFYLIPYQCLQNKSLILCNVLFGNGEAVNPLRDGIHKFEDNYTIYITPDGKMHYKYWLLLLIVLIAWLFFAAFVLYRQIGKYHSCRNKLMLLSEISDAETGDTAIPHDVMPSVPKKLKKIIFCPLISSPLTIGLFHPVMILPKEYNSEDLPMYLSHELCHIRNHDALWKFISFITILIHWYNPFAYLLFLEIYGVCEKNCDEMVIAPFNETQKMYYANLIIESARNHSGSPLLFTGTFSTNNKLTKERILSMERKKCKSLCRKVITALLTGVVALSMPISVLAYQPVYVYRDLPDYELNGDVMYIVFNGEQSPLAAPDTSYLDFSISNEIIVDEYGNQYAVNAENAQIVQTCTHEYITGQRNYHVKNGSGGCTLYTYEGTYCKKCGHCLQETLIGQTSLIKCPH